MSEVEIVMSEATDCDESLPTWRLGTEVKTVESWTHMCVT